MSSGFFGIGTVDLDSIFHSGLNIYNRDDRMGFIAPGPNTDPNSNSVFRRYVSRGPVVSSDTRLFYEGTDLRNLLGGRVTAEAVDTYFPNHVTVSSVNPNTPAFYTLWVGPSSIGASIAGHAEYPIDQGDATFHDSWAIGSIAPSNAQAIATFTSGTNPNPLAGTPTFLGSPVGSWLDLTQLRSWTVENYQLGGIIHSHVRIRIRRKSDSVILVDKTIQVSTYHPNPDGGPIEIS